MHPSSLKMTRNSRTNGCAGAFLIVVGLGLMGIPLQDGVPLGLFHVAYQTASFLVFELVGLAFFVGGVWVLAFRSAFEQPDVDAPAQVRQGDVFDFRYRQRARRGVAVRSIDLYFVYREDVAWGESDSPSRYVFDRLIAKQTFPGGKFARGDEIVIEAAFHVPMGEMGVRNPYMHLRGAKVKRGWVVRPRIRFDRGSEAWEDHEISIVSPADEPAEAAESGAHQDLYDVLLLPSPLERTGAIRDALAEVAPELGESGVPYAQHSAANVIRERVGEDEAEAIAERLRSAGAVVNVVPTEATWWLPTTGKVREQPAESANFER